MTARPASAILAEIQDMLETRAIGLYGLHAVTQQQHALQAAWLAERDGAVRLRRYDDAAKAEGLETPPVAHFMGSVARCMETSR